MVLLADPRTRTIAVYRKDAASAVSGANATLTLEGMVPVFPLSLRDVFQE